MNEKAFQAIAMKTGESVTGSNVFTATTTTGVGCSDGTVQTHVRNTIITSPIALTEIYNGSADKVTGWNLGAKGASVITESNTYGTASSGRFPNYATICADHGSVTNYIASLDQSHSDVTSFAFDGKPVSIVVNPYVAPAPIETPSSDQATSPAAPQTSGSGALRVSSLTYAADSRPGLDRVRRSSDPREGNRIRYPIRVC